MIIIVDNGITTGIEGAEGENTTDQWYSLDGKKLNSKPKAAGIYIKNGKKVVIKWEKWKLAYTSERERAQGRD